MLSIQQKLAVSLVIKVQAPVWFWLVGPADNMRKHPESTDWRRENMHNNIAQGFDQLILEQNSFKLGE